MASAIRKLTMFFLKKTFLDFPIKISFADIFLEGDLSYKYISILQVDFNMRNFQ